jgi:periplasmic protein TonB
MSEVPTGASPNARFLAGQVPSTKDETARFVSAIGLSGASQFLLFLLGFLIIANLPSPAPAADPNPNYGRMVFIATPGPGGGGGGGGNKMPDPPRRVEMPDRDKMTVPVARPPKMEVPKDVVKPPQQMDVPIQPVELGVQPLPGAVSPMPSPTASQGSGSGGGGGTGRGTGSGPGQGSGLGPGYGGGFGGGARRPGSGISFPVPLQQPKPNYTADAMRAKIQGVVWLEAVVLENGSVGQVRVIRSLDPTFGLDQEAERTVKRWLFQPGKNQMGEAVATIVEIEMTFTLR